MVTLIIFILACLGLTNILVNESIFDKPRNFIAKHFQYSLLNKLIHCEVCLGFWVGILIAILFPTFGIHWLVAGFVSSAANKIINIVLYKF